MAFLEIKNLKKNFGDTEVLKGVSVELERGEALAVIGSSGGGKTTLLRCVAFLERADSGEITLNGKTVFAATDGKKDKKSKRACASVRPNIGMVFQSFNLFPHYNVQKNLTLAARLQYNKTVKRSLRSILSGEARRNKKAEYRSLDERAAALLKRVGLEDKAKSYPCELSGGQQQRAAIARALMVGPELLCFDEPTSALDPELTREVLRVISELKRDGYTVIVVTHEMEFARTVADKVAFVADGRIVVQGSAEEVFDSPAVKSFINN